MQKFYFSEGLVGKKWAKAVCLTVASDGLIERIDTDVEFPETAQVRGAVLPAMPNLHSHAFQRIFAGLTEYKAPGKSDFWSWREAMYGFAAHMTAEAMEIVAAQLYMEMLKAGYCAVGEFHYLHNSHRDMALASSEAIIAAAETTGIALTHLPVLYQTSDFGGKAPERGQLPFVHANKDFVRLLQVLGPRVQGRHRLGMAFHSLRAVDEGSFAQVIDALDSMNPKAPIHIHIAEQVKEVDSCLSHTGQRPIEWLTAHLPVNERWTLIHATHLVEEEWRSVAARGAIVGLCPTTEANLGDGLFPLPEFLKHKGRFGIGSDSHISVDSREELRLLEYGQRLARQERNVLTDPEGGHTGVFLWREAALGGAQSLGQPVGELAEGKRADFIVIDNKHFGLCAASYCQIVDAFIFSGQPSSISDVMVAGHWVVTDGKHKNEDIITQRYKELVASLTARLEGEG